MTQVSTSPVGNQWSPNPRNDSLPKEIVVPLCQERKGIAKYSKVIALGIASALVMSLCLAAMPIEKAKAQTPPMPYVLYGYTFAEDHSILPSCTLKVVNRATMNSSMISSDSGGWYQFDLSSLPGEYQTGDEIWLLGNKTMEIGLNRTSVTNSGGKWLNLTLSAHTPIRIESNSDFDAMRGVSSGSGAALDPYIIQGRDISGAGYGYCMYFGNTTSYFVVRDCRLHQASGVGRYPWANDAGLTLYNASNGRIWNTTSYSNSWTGIYLYFSGNNTISNSTVYSNGHGIVLHYSNDTAILNNSVYSNTYGMHLDTSCRNEVSNNVLTGGSYAISTYYADSNNILNNTIDSTSYGVDLSECDDNMIANNTITSTSTGIHMRQCNNNTVSGNSLSGCNYGLYLDQSNTDNTLANNTCSYNQYGILLTSSSGNALSNNTCSFNTLSGMYLGSSSSNTASRNTCSNNGEHGILIQSSSSNTVSNNTCMYNSLYGLHVQFSNSNSVTNNTCSDNSHSGMIVTSSSGNAIENNSCSGNVWDGIGTAGCGSNTLSYNNCSGNTYGIAMVSSTGQTLRNNAMVSDGIYIWTSEHSSSHWNTHDIDASNTVNGKPVYYYKNNVGGTVPTGAGNVILASCQYMIVENQILNNAGWGIAIGFSSGIVVSNNTCSNNLISSMQFYESNGCTITNNTCSNGASLLLYTSSNNKLENNTFLGNNWVGIDMYYSSNGNKISNNTITHSTSMAIYIYSSNNNKIWNNTFDHNNGAGDTYNPSHVQAYDGGSNNRWNSSGVPHGYGNYWSDWTRPDANGDLIVDSPYVIGSSQDYYPRTWASNWTLHLLPGWNFISVPLVDFTYNASTLGLATGDMVCSWDSLAKVYSIYIVGISPSAYDFEIEPGAGYFIRAVSEKNLTLLGDHPDKYSSYSFSLDVPAGGGWVDVGWTSFDTSRHASDLASYVTGTNAKLVCKYNATAKQYMIYVVGLSPPAYDFNILPGDAMWVWVGAAGGTLTYSP